MSNPNKHPAPAKVRPKVGGKQPRAKRLDIGQKYVSGQVQGDPQNKLAPQAQGVSQARTALAALLATRADLRAQLTRNTSAIVVADAAYSTALGTYATAAAAFSAGDASLLAVLGVDEAQKPTKPADAVIAAPVVQVAPGAADGEVKLRCGRVPHAGGYVFAYKLEPSQPADPWLGNINTKLASTTVQGLAPAQLVRARVRAVGVAPGPWSVEVVGRAR